MDGASPARLAQEVADAARQRAATGSPYLDRVRRATALLGITETTAEDVRSALLSVEDYASIDVDAPTASRWRAGALVKLGVKRLTRWYFRYVGYRVTLFGYAVVRFGMATSELTEGLEETTRALREKVDILEARLERLEHKVDCP